MSQVFLFLALVSLVLAATAACNSPPEQIPERDTSSVSATSTPPSLTAVTPTIPLDETTEPVPAATPTPTNSPTPARSLNTQELASLQGAIQDAAEMVDIVNQCAAQDGDTPPDIAVSINEQSRWYADAVINHRECIASELTGVDFTEGN